MTAKSSQNRTGTYNNKPYHLGNNIRCIFILLFTVDRFYQDKTLLTVTSVSIILNTLGVTWLYSALEQYSYITVRNIACKLVSVILMFIFVHNTSDYVIYGVIAVLASGGSNLLNFINLKNIFLCDP